MQWLRAVQALSSVAAKSAASEPKEWPTERRQLLDISDFGNYNILKDYFKGIIEKYRLPKSNNSFYTAARVVVALMQEIHADDSHAGDESDSCDRTDIKCHLEAVEKHLPVQDSDQDYYGSTYATLRGTDWRGTDCDDSNKTCILVALARMET